MNTLDILTQVRELLSDPERWHRGGHFATNKHGCRVSSSESEAAQWSICGALEKVQGSPTFHGSAYDLLSTLCVNRGYSPRSVDAFNSLPTTHDDVMSLLSEAIVEALNNPRSFI
jgi:hypothetical protein